MRVMRVAIYRRVSTRRQAQDGVSLDQQYETCHDYATARGWVVAVDYVESGRSAFTEDLRRRPAFQRMLADARTGQFDVVFVYELSRFARRQRVQFSAAGELEQFGVKVVSVTEPMDLETVEGFVTYSVLSMQAELHSRLLSRRIKALRARERAQGRATKHPAKGQRWRDGRLVWDEPACDLPRRAFALAEMGMGTPTIRQRLLDEGYQISISSLHYLLNNPAYIGMIRHQGQLTPAEWPPLISQGTWDHVQSLRRGRHPQHSVRPTVRATAHATLAGLLYCANCGAKLYYDHHAGRRHYYLCRCQSDGGHCAARPCRADRLDSQVADLITSLALTPAIVAKAQSYVRDARPRPTPPPGDTAERLRRLARAYADGAFSDEEYDARRAALSAPTPPTTAPPLDLDAAVALVGDLPALWAEATVPRRRELLGRLVSQIYARRHEIYAIRPTRLAEPLFRALWDQPCRDMSSRLPHTVHRPVLLTAA